MGQTIFVTLEPVYCAGCGITFGMSKDYIEQRRSDHKGWFCPNGHSNYWPQESDKDRVQRLNGQLDQERTRRQAAEEEARKKEAARKVLSVKLSKQTKRIAAGVCPCCQRTFQQLARHMKTKHPEVK